MMSSDRSTGTDALAGIMGEEIQLLRRDYETQFQCQRRFRETAAVSGCSPERPCTSCYERCSSTY
ncbi:hypothetical protein RGR602_CH00336 [Rhizobium gallicum bv. gallicum R602sp]|uniref:Uncharacterized protein n=1 Tax=Rhizobium gallicum bv. gallicum R602sp TaxID=1041138 RepID=A0A0B4WZJ3_9HYPH|nr:hypothetical protein RGR602_CH00336 [Rhizobium gallicum bv. gallicum R602sp]